MKVLFIDRWARHAIDNQFKPLSEIAPKTDSFTLLHFGSIFDDEFVQSEEIKVERLNIKDISEYRSNGILAKDIILKEEPDVIAFSGPVNQPVFQAFILTAQEMSIPIGVMQYGVYPSDNKETESVKKSLLKLRNFRKYKYNFWSLIYFYSSLRYFKSFSKSVKKTLALFLLMAIYRNRYFWMPLPDRIYSPDFSIIFTEVLKNWELRRLNIKEANVYICGSPFISSQQEVVNTFDEEKNIAFIVHQPFIEDGLIDNKDWLLQQYVEIGKALKRQGYRDIFLKLHPRAKTDLYESLGNNSEIKVLKEGNIDTLINEATIVIGASSTVLINAIMQRKPTFITSWIGPELIREIGYLNQEVFEISKNINEFENALSSSISPPDESQVQEFLDKFVGPAVGREAFQNMYHVLKTVHRNV